MLDSDTGADAAPVAERLTETRAEPGPAAPASRRLLLQFTGSGAEYFRIWLLHLLLIVLTLGLYLPFAKARRIRYLYANTWVDGDALAFHGYPWTMFRGFMVLVALFGVYAIGGRFSPLAGYVAFLALCVLWPSLWRAGQQFRLANTSWRGLRMAFRGDLGDAYSAFGAAIWPLVLLIGVQQFARAVLEGSVAISPAVGQAHRRQHGHRRQPGRAAVCRAAAAGAGQGSSTTSTTITSWPTSAGRMQVKTRRFYGLAFATACWVLVPMLVLIGLLFIPGVRSTLDANKTAGLVAMTGVIGVYLLSFVLVGPFFNARLQNLVWNHTASEQVRFASQLRFRSLAWLTAKNWLLTLLTLGLYRPFAAINTWKLRLEAVSIDVDGTMDGWDGSESAAYADASGEAAGDFFGIDLGL